MPERQNYPSLVLYSQFTGATYDVYGKGLAGLNFSPASAMDLLCNAYSNASDDEPETEPVGESKLESRVPPPSKRFKAEHWCHPVPRPTYYHTSDLSREAPIPGRYVSKRERALSSAMTAAPDRKANPLVISPPVLGSIADSDLPHDIRSSLREQPKEQQSRIPRRLSIALHSHTKAVNAIHWSPSHAHLLASAGFDNAICIWNVWSRDQKKACMFSFHSAPVKDVKWSEKGLFVLSCGYDCSSRLIDVEKGIETQNFKEDQVVGVIKFHPHNSNLFLSGGSNGRLRLWDIRTGKAIHEYIRRLGPILDIEFLNDGKQFISSSDVSSSNVSENSIIVWDVSRQVPLSNQVYAEAYACPSVKCHPFDPCFVAQSHGNYIAIFSSSPPFKLNKYKRYESHGVSGFPIKCNFSLDGEKIVSGSSEGSICFYNYQSSELIQKIKAYEQPCIDVAFHPILPNVVASCSWTGDVSIYE